MILEKGFEPWDLFGNSFQGIVDGDPAERFYTGAAYCPVGKVLNLGTCMEIHSRILLMVILQKGFILEQLSALLEKGLIWDQLTALLVYVHYTTLS